MTIVAGGSVRRLWLVAALGLVLVIVAAPLGIGEAVAARQAGGTADCPTDSGAAATTSPLERSRATATALAGGSDAPAPACLPTDRARGEIAAELPPPDLPTMGPEGYRFRLAATLAAELAEVPSEAAVYELDRRPLAEEEVEQLAIRLGLDGSVERRGEGSFVVSGNGELFVAPDLIQYVAPGTPASGELPDDEAAVTAARFWLRRSGLEPTDLGRGRVVSRVDAPARLVVLFGPREPEPLLAAYPTLTVSLGAGGSVLDASSRWAEIVRSERYRLRGGERAWSEVEAGRAYLDVAFGDAGPAAGAEVAGAVAYETVGLAYTSAGPPGGRQYLQPVYVFGGRLTPEGAEESYPVNAYVPALAIGDGPVGVVAGAVYG